MISPRWSEFRLLTCAKVGDHEPGNVCFLSPKDIPSGSSFAVVKCDNGGETFFCRLRCNDSDRTEGGRIGICQCNSHSLHFNRDQRGLAAFFSEQDFPKLSKVYLESVAHEGSGNDDADCEKVLQRLADLVQVPRYI